MNYCGFCATMRSASKENRCEVCSHLIWELESVSAHLEKGYAPRAGGIPSSVYAGLVKWGWKGPEMKVTVAVIHNPPVSAAPVAVIAPKIPAPVKVPVKSRARVAASGIDSERTARAVANLAAKMVALNPVAVVPVVEVIETLQPIGQAKPRVLPPVVTEKPKWVDGLHTWQYIAMGLVAAENVVKSKRRKTA